MDPEPRALALDRRASCAAGGRLHAGLDRVWAAVVASETAFTAEGVHYRLDPAAHTIVIHGQWWFAMQVVLDADGDWTCVTWRIINIAPGWTRWLASVSHVPGACRNLPTVAARRLEALAAALGCDLEPQTTFMP